MNFFTREEIYIGYSVSEVEAIESALKEADIKFKETRHSSTGRMIGFSTSRDRMGTAGQNLSYDSQYSIFVHRDDRERARYLAEKTLRELRK